VLVFEADVDVVLSRAELDPSEGLGLGLFCAAARANVNAWTRNETKYMVETPILGP